MLAELTRVRKRCLSLSLRLFRRHPTPDGELPAGQQAFSELDGFLSELLKRLDMRVSGENGENTDALQMTLQVAITGEKVFKLTTEPAVSGIYRQITSLLGLMESWASKLGASVSHPDTMSLSDWLNLEKALQSGQSLVEKVLQNLSCLQPGDTVDGNLPDTS